MDVERESTKRDLDASPPIRTKSTSSLAGWLNRLDEKQRRCLYELWIMFILYVRQHDFRADKRFQNNLELGTFLYKQLESAKIDLCKNPLDANLIEKSGAAKELFMQAATDDLDTILLRFLRARKWKLPEAFSMLIDFLKWRIQVGVHRLLQEGERCLSPNLFKSGKSFTWGEDKKGRLCVYIRARLHDKNANTIEENTRYVIYCLETGRRLRRYDEQRVIVVVDMSNLTWASLDFPFAQMIMRFLQAYYPEILAHVLIVNAPWMFWGFWKLLSSVLDPVVAAKFKWIEGDELASYIGDSLPMEFGGKTFSFSQAFDRAKSIEEFEKREMDLDGLKRMRDLEAELLRVTAEIYRRNISAPALEEERKSLKKQLRRGYYNLLRPVYPSTMYDRLDLFNVHDGSIDWSRYSKNENENER